MVACKGRTDKQRVRGNERDKQRGREKETKIATDPEYLNHERVRHAVLCRRGRAENVSTD